MVTTRRRITSEQDRFGGYGIQPSGTVTIDEPQTETPSFMQSDRYSFRTVTDEPAFSADVSATDSRVKQTEQPSQPDVIEYSSRPYNLTYDFLMPPAKQAKKQRRREKEDVMPSIRTRAYASAEEEKSEKKAAQAKISGKTKAALIAYVAAVVVFAILIIATGLAVSNINARSAELETEIAVKNERLAALNAEILGLTDMDAIAEAAANNGMQKIDSSIAVDLIPATDPVRYEGRTNWFDKFCDFISNIFGG